MPPREDAQGQAGEDLVNEDGEQGWKKKAGRPSRRLHGGRAESRPVARSSGRDNSPLPGGAPLCDTGALTWKKSCLSDWVDAGRLFFARGLPRLSQQLLRKNRAGARVIACFLRGP